MFTINGKYTNADIMIDNVDATTLAQIHSMINNEAFTNHVVIMPDTHAGSGSVIGFTMPLGDKIVPMTVGVDLSCSVTSKRYDSTIFNNITFEQFDKAVRAAVPFGKEVNEHISRYFNMGIFLENINTRIREFTMKYYTKTGINYGLVKWNENVLYGMFKEIGGDTSRIMRSLGTVGSGNHFCEIGTDSNNDFWFTVHTGSRNLGKLVAEYWQNKAFKNKTNVLSKAAYVETIKKEFPKEQWQKEINKYNETIKTVGKTGMEYLTGDDMFDYLTHTIVAHEYALMNHYCIHQTLRDLMIAGGAEMHTLDQIVTTHNKIDLDDWVIRKGAVRASDGEIFLCPMNMKDGILLCVGNGNPEWNNSAPHGAGRVLSRSQANKQLSGFDALQAMKGIYTSNLPLDEAPAAYKDAKIIEEAIAPTAVIIDKIIPVMNMKGG